VVPVLLIGRGYDFAANQQLLQDLRAGLSAEEISALEGQLHGAKSGSTLAGLDEVQAVLAEAIPNIIAVNWHPEGGDNHLTATVDDIIRRFPARPTKHSTKVWERLYRRSSSSSNRKKPEAPAEGSSPNTWA